MNTNLLKPPSGDRIWIWTGLMGLLLMLLGVIVITASTVATMAVSWFLGLCLIVGGVAQLFHTYRFPRLNSPVIRFLLATFSIIAGAVILKSPIVGAVGMTLALAIYLFFSAVVKAVLAFEGNSVSGRSWLILSSIISFFLGICLFVTFPLTSWVIPGTLLGVDLVFYGLSILVTARRFRRGEISFEATKLRRVA
jgi:uncharacterized membrane protein HdeD (DUF308 family)